MLDLDNPQTQHIFKASGLLDHIKLASQAITTAATPERQILLAECRSSVEALHRLNDEHFRSSEFNARKLAEMEAALQVLAGGASESLAASDGVCCPRCGAALMHIDTKYLQRSLCSPCLEGVHAAEAALGGDRGFGTVFI